MKICHIKVEFTELYYHTYICSCKYFVLFLSFYCLIKSHFCQCFPVHFIGEQMYVCIKGVSLVQTLTTLSLYFSDYFLVLCDDKKEFYRRTLRP